MLMRRLGLAGGGGEEDVGRRARSCSGAGAGAGPGSKGRVEGEAGGERKEGCEKVAAVGVEGEERAGEAGEEEEERRRWMGEGEAEWTLGEWDSDMLCAEGHRELIQDTTRPMRGRRGNGEHGQPTTQWHIWKFTQP